ncbi:MAG: glycosyltransferase N-terminal domain-containing protein [Ginsengibacter sp.]
MSKHTGLILLYNLFLAIYSAGIFIVSPWNKKAKLWIKGRKNLLKKIQKNYLYTPGTVWMHCASLGEFEQGRPVLKYLQENIPDVSIVITFFSPSGYEIAARDKDFKQVFYLPMDSPFHARKLVEIFKPDLVLWIKYEYWHYYLKELKTRNIPVLLISGIYRQSHPFFKWYGKFWKNMLAGFSHFFVQEQASKAQLEKIIPPEKITVSGDTRCDRVINIADNFTDVAGIAGFCGDKKVIVAGSTWEDDEAEWTHYVKQHPEIKFIFAPHEIDAENLDFVKKEFPGSVFYTEWLSGAVNHSPHCLIIDNIGMLSRLYQYATITYVGGGFGYNGLHNILEASVYGKPVIFGPEYEKNFEAEELIECSGGISIENALELEKVVNDLLENEEELHSRGVAAKNYVYKNAGASQKIIAYIQKNRLLTN